MAVLPPAGRQCQKEIKERKQQRELQESAGNIILHLHSEIGMVCVREFLHQDGAGLPIEKGKRHDRRDRSQTREDPQPWIGLGQAPELILPGVRLFQHMVHPVKQSQKQGSCVTDTDEQDE